MAFQDKVALVTGAARGLGKAYAEALLEGGAKVVILDILDDTGKETEEEFLARYGSGSALYIHADTTNDSQVETAFDKAVEVFGGLDIVINNAGVTAFGTPEWDRVISINLRGTIRCCEAAITRMRTDGKGRGGTIINISSQVGIICLPGGADYTASKHAVVGYTRARALQLGEQTGIKFRLICPACIKTDLTKPLQEAEAQGAAIADAILNSTGGWVPVSLVVRACMMGITREDLPQGAVIKVTADGIRQMFPEQMPGKLLEENE